MSSKVIFYALGQRFLEREADRPADAKQVVYYSLAIGHHIGVIDCFKAIIDCPYEAYRQWIGHLPEGSEARGKMEGLLKFGEITIDQTHIHMLGAAFDKILPGLSPYETAWTKTLLQALAVIEKEPAVYLMVKAR